MKFFPVAFVSFLRHAATIEISTFLAPGSNFYLIIEIETQFSELRSQNILNCLINQNCLNFQKILKILKSFFLLPARRRRCRAVLENFSRIGKICHFFQALLELPDIPINTISWKLPNPTRFSICFHSRIFKKFCIESCQKIPTSSYARTVPIQKLEIW